MAVGAILVLVLSLIVYFTSGGGIESGATTTTTIVTTKTVPAPIETVTVVQTVTETTTRSVRVTETTTIVATRTITVTKTTTIPLVVTETVTVTRPIVVAAAPCKGYDPGVFNLDAVECGLSELDNLRELAYSLVAGDWWSTVVSIAHWVAVNIEYEKDIVQHGMREYVQMPSETLLLGKGDCEDRALLAAALFAATGFFEEVVVVSVEFKGLDVGHVEPGVVVNGTIYVVPIVEDPYPAHLYSDYYGLWKSAGLSIENGKIYLYNTRSRNIRVLDIDSGVFRMVYPPPLDIEHLEAIREAIAAYLVMQGFQLECPAYLTSLARYMASYLPSSEPPVKVSYYMVLRPVDWFSPKKPSWVAKRIQLALALNENLTNYLLQLGARKTCVYVYVEVENTTVPVYRYRPDGTPIKVLEERPTIIVYFLVAPDYPVPRVEVELNETMLVVYVWSTDRVSILLYEPGSVEPILGVAMPGYYYPGVETITAMIWEISGDKTIIVVDRGLLDAKLPGPGTYILIVWVSDKQAYIAPYEPLK